MVVYRLEISQLAMIQSPRDYYVPLDRWAIGGSMKKTDLSPPPSASPPGEIRSRIREDTHLDRDRIRRSCQRPCADRPGRQTDSRRDYVIYGKPECHPANEINGGEERGCRYVVACETSIERALRLNATTLGNE